jgi:NAD(P)-dependent dehydrogenase (short-subunit alcohol dehydrogenase family)
VRITGKRALITGAAVGTGRAIAERLAAEGAEVVLVDIDASAGSRAAAAIGSSARFEPVDVRDDVAVAAVLECRPDILVNNAGGGPDLRPCFPEASAARWTASLELNLRAPMLATQLVLESMRRAGGGAVVNVGSTAGLGNGPHVSPEYSAAKAGLIRFTSTLAGLRESHGVRVNCVVPDWVGTERGLAEQAALPPPERGPALVSLETLTDAVVRFVEDEALAGRVILLDRGKPPELLPSP